MRREREVMIDRILVYIVAAIVVFWGGLLIMSALQGANVLPRFTMRPDALEFTAYKAVTMLLLGQACVIIGVVAAIWWGRADREVVAS